MLSTIGGALRRCAGHSWNTEVSPVRTTEQQQNSWFFLSSNTTKFEDKFILKKSHRKVTFQEDEYVIFQDDSYKVGLVVKKDELMEETEIHQMEPVTQTSYRFCDGPTIDVCIDSIVYVLQNPKLVNKNGCSLYNFKKSQLKKYIV